jgi:hypothetical protein
MITELPEPEVKTTQTPEVETNVPLHKKALCGNHPFGDFFYLFWKDIDCPCCLFFRGMAVGVVGLSVIYTAFKLIF